MPGRTVGPDCGALLSAAATRLHPGTGRVAALLGALRWRPRRARAVLDLLGEAPRQPGVGGPLAEAACGVGAAGAVGDGHAPADDPLPARGAGQRAPGRAAVPLCGRPD